ncbi:MAG: hypothetical protein IKI03_10380 [Clostridia bacterium]|nr:hypothetical protein [Clostridia bacterium]
MREIFKSLFGNDRLKRTLGEAIENGTASHAYILEGPKGSGKHTAAILASAALGCENRTDAKYPLPCGVCPVCGRILKGISADVITTSKDDRASIGVGKIRSIREDLYVTPNDSDKKIYIIEEAELLTTQAQNALLISLEEPPPFVTFFLLTENSEALLETIRSRAVTVRMELFTPQKVKEYLEGLPLTDSKGKDHSERIIRAVEASNGSIGEAKRILTGDEKKEENLTVKTRIFTVKLVTGKTSDAISIITPFLSNGFETSNRILTEVSSLVAAMIKFKKASTSEYDIALNEEETDTLRSVSLKRLVDIFDMTAYALDLISSNATPKNVIYDLIFKCRI